MNETLARTKDEAERETKSKRRVPLAEQVFAEIRRRIIENEYPIGYQALEMDLAKEFGMSRTPIREALIQLEKEGLVEIIPRHGHAGAADPRSRTCWRSSRCSPTWSSWPST